MTAGWTEDRVGALKKLWLEGQSASQIAKQLGGGVTRNAVIGKVHRLGLSGRAAPSQPARATFRPSRPRRRRNARHRHGDDLGRPHVQMADRGPVLDRVQLLRPPGLGRRLLRRTRPRRLSAGDEARWGDRSGPLAAALYLGALSLATRSLAA